MFIGVDEQDRVVEISRFPVIGDGIRQVALDMTFNDLQAHLEDLAQTDRSLLYYRNGQFVLEEREPTPDDLQNERGQQALQRLSADINLSTPRSVEERLADLTYIIIAQIGGPVE